MMVDPLSSQSFHGIAASYKSEISRAQPQVESDPQVDQFSRKFSEILSQDSSTAVSHEHSRVEIVRNAIQSYPTRFAELSEGEKDAFTEMFVDMSVSANHSYSYGNSAPAKGSLINVQA